MRWTRNLIGIDPGECMPDKLASDPMAPLLEQAERLAERLAGYRRAVSHLLYGSEDEMRERLRILFYLVQSSWVSIQELSAISNAPSNEYQRLAGLKIIEQREGMVKMTPFGESLLTLLLIFEKNIDGAMSEGFLEMAQAFLAGKLDIDTIARIQIGAARRLEDDLEQSTSTESLIELSRRESTRKGAANHVERMIGTLRAQLSPDRERELEGAAVALHQTHLRQERVHLRILKDDVRYGRGYSHRDLIERWRGHSLDSLARTMNNFPDLFRTVGSANTSIAFDAGLRPVFETSRSALTEPTRFDMVEGEFKAPPLPPAWQALAEDLQRAADGSLLHEVATSARSYFAAVSFMNRSKLPPNFPVQDVAFYIEDSARVSQPPYLDVPRITIRRRIP